MQTCRCFEEFSLGQPRLKPWPTSEQGRWKRPEEGRDLLSVHLPHSGHVASRGGPARSNLQYRHLPRRLRRRASSSSRHKYAVGIAITRKLHQSGTTSVPGPQESLYPNCVQSITKDWSKRRMIPFAGARGSGTCSPTFIHSAPRSTKMYRHEFSYFSIHHPLRSQIVRITVPVAVPIHSTT